MHSQLMLVLVKSCFGPNIYKQLLITIGLQAIWAVAIYLFE